MGEVDHQSRSVFSGNVVTVHYSSLHTNTFLEEPEVHDGTYESLHGLDDLVDHEDQEEESTHHDKEHAHDAEQEEQTELIH